MCGIYELADAEKQRERGRERDRETVWCVENRAGERRCTGSFAWLESKEAERRVFSPLFEERGSVANHTHTAGKQH